MAGHSPPLQPPPPPLPLPPPAQYWCYQCNKRVPVETLPDHPDVICFECNSGFVESISASPHERQVSDEETPAFSNEFLHYLRLIALAAREGDEPPPPPSDHPPGDNDYLRIELDPHLGDQVRAQFDDDDDDEQEEANDNQNEDEDDDDLVRRDRRNALHHQLRDFASRAASRRNRILDWAEILMGLEDGDDDAYVSNPGDYVDAAGYEALLQTLAESDGGGGRRGAPPAAKSAVEGLLTVEVKSSEMEACAICKDRVFNCEGKVVKQLECGHMYHGDCIICWLETKNSCPLCRFELPTDDPEYEEDRRKRLVTVAARGCSSSSRAD